MTRKATARMTCSSRHRGGGEPRTLHQPVADPDAPIFTVMAPFSKDKGAGFQADAGGRNLPYLVILMNSLSSPVRWDAYDWLAVGMSIAGVAAVSLADQSTRTQAQHLEDGPAKDVASEIRRFGGYYSYATLGLFYAGGEIFHDPPARAVFIDGAAATLVASGIITPALKYAIGRSRPRAGRGAYYFAPFSNNNASFPSGETTQAFAVASVIAAHYDSLWVQVPSYGIAGLVGMARIYEHGHWTSDALAGALTGTTVGTAIVHFNEKRRKADKEETGIFITPLLARGTGGIAITLVR